MTDIGNRSYRLLCIGEMWLGSDSRDAFMALIRLGNSIQVIDEHIYSGATWRSMSTRIIRRILRPLLVRELYLEARRLESVFRPHGVFVFKGNVVHPDLIRYFKKRGIPVVNYYPDVSFRTHGTYIPRALPLYDHIFTTKSWGIADMQSQLGVKNISFLEHGFDPEIHHPWRLDEEDRKLYGCDVVFIGTWSPKKEALLSHLKRSMPAVKIRIWGGAWNKSSSRELASSIVGSEITGQAYSKVLQAASICLGFLSEQRKGSTSGDLITSRTFNIPACGAFMLHERNEESIQYFTEREEAAFFESPEELVKCVRFYLKHPDIRANIARKGRERCIKSGYSIDDRMAHVSKWFAGHIPTRT